MLSDMMIEDVRRFQEQILCKPFPTKPQNFSAELEHETVVRLDEEIEEFQHAKLLSDKADALVDLIYFALGALHQAGVDTRRVWTAVQHANMTKVRGITKRGDDNDAAKPDDWTPPDHTWLDI